MDKPGTTRRVGSVSDLHVVLEKRDSTKDDNNKHLLGRLFAFVSRTGPRQKRGMRGYRLLAGKTRDEAEGPCGVGSASVNTTPALHSVGTWPIHVT